MTEIFDTFPQRQATAAQTFEWATLPRVCEGLVHSGAKFIVRGWGWRRQSRRQARARVSGALGFAPP